MPHQQLCSWWLPLSDNSYTKHPPFNSSINIRDYPLIHVEFISLR